MSQLASNLAGLSPGSSVGQKKLGVNGYQVCVQAPIEPGMGETQGKEAPPEEQPGKGGRKAHLQATKVSKLTVAEKLRVLSHWSGVGTHIVFAK